MWKVSTENGGLERKKVKTRRNRCTVLSKIRSVCYDLMFKIRTGVSMRLCFIQSVQLYDVMIPPPPPPPPRILLKGLIDASEVLEY